MSPLTPRRRRSGRRLTSLAAVLALAATSALNLPTARADAGVTPADGSFTVSGAGFGHGRGMSQYGAYGAARQGLDWKQILSFYYPGTKRVQQSASADITVWITADSDSNLKVMPAAGLALRDGDGHTLALPTGSGYTAWRVTRSGSGSSLAYRKPSGTWAARKTALTGSTWWFSNDAEILKVWLPGGAKRELRGTVALVAGGSGGRTVNRLPMDDYVKGVVPLEMPTSWHAEAVRAQAVAARSYAARLQLARRAGSGYDVCDTTSCQVYRGYALTSGGHRRLYETKRGTEAVAATARTVLHSGKSLALTEFGSSNGGSTVASSKSYQVAKLDPYDAVITANAWHRDVTVASVGRAWPSVGTVTSIRVTKRTGTGRWGGRVTSMTVVGNRDSVTISGSAFSSRLGLRSSLFTVG